jgi:hypothetical protein
LKPQTPIAPVSPTQHTSHENSPPLMRAVLFPYIRIHSPKRTVMKKFVFTLSLASCAIAATAQINSQTTINQVKAGINAGGDLFWNTSVGQFEVPAGSGNHTIFAGNLWIGGLDGTNQLHVAGQTYRQTGTDFFQGPVMSSGNYSQANDALWNLVWKINKTTIDSFILWTINPNQYPNYVVPTIIQNWPGNGNVNLGQTPQLLPYVDVDGDGIYNYTAGDYPCIKGDQAVFALFNDDRNTHTETGGAKLGIQVIAMLYGYRRVGSPVDTTLFLEYQISNLSSNAYHDVYVGNWTDFDLGGPFDDYVGCDVTRALYYAYNGNAIDQSYGPNPPAQGVVYLNMPLAPIADNVDNDQDGSIDEVGEQVSMNYFQTYNNDFTSTGNPINAANFYGYMTGEWLDASSVTYGGNGFQGSTQARYMYPGNTDPNGFGTGGIPQAAWDEVSAGNAFGDRRGIGSAGPFLLNAGATISLSYAYVYGRGSNGPASSVIAMQAAADSARNFYNTTLVNACNPTPTALGYLPKPAEISVFPNPANELLFVNVTSKNATAQFAILDITGRVLKTETLTTSSQQHISLNGLPAGIYVLRVNDGQAQGLIRFVKQ